MITRICPVLCLLLYHIYTPFHFLILCSNLHSSAMETFCINLPSTLCLYLYYTCMYVIHVCMYVWDHTVSRCISTDCTRVLSQYTYIHRVSVVTLYFVYGRFILRVSSLHTTCHFTVHALCICLHGYLTNTNKIEYCFQIFIDNHHLTHHL